MGYLAKGRIRFIAMALGAAAMGIRPPVRKKTEWGKATPIRIFLPGGLG